jgi:hypothetical protein
MSPAVHADPLSYDMIGEIDRGAAGMDWFVKSEGADGKIASTLCHDWDKAVELHNELWAKGIKTWIEDMDGRRVGAVTPTPPPKKL